VIEIKLDTELKNSGVKEGLAEKDITKIADAIKEIGKAGGEAQAGQSLATLEGKKAKEAMDGKGSFVQSFIDDAIPSALQRGKDFQYMQNWENGNRDAAIKKVDNIQDFQTAKKNVASAFGEDLYGSAGHTVGNVLGGVQLASQVAGMIGGMYATGGKAISVGQNMIDSTRRKLDNNTFMGKTSGGEYKEYSGKIPSDVEEYIKHNTGKNAPKNSKGNTIIPEQLTGVATNLSSKSIVKTSDNTNDKTTNNTDTSPDNNPSHSQSPSLNSNTIIPENTQNINSLGSELQNITITNAKFIGSDFEQTASKMANQSWVEQKGNAI